MAHEAGIAMMATLRMGRKMGIDHQDLQTRLCCVITGSGTHGATTNND
ncbi:hypothetical protein N037_02330 [Enterobacter sp. EGD-HP1]|nr:hypothetical protein N037_02330 [Enterobacter sp. EGD-HP1]